jgi:catechol 2,3-dioxygenase-like lactoylglutathione lyase family enzyme
MDQPRTELVATVLGSPDPIGLARFYRDLLGWEITYEDPAWVKLRPDAGPGLAFQIEENHTPPVWPAGNGDQQMQMHLDIRAADLDTEVARAIELGARLADHQPQDDVRVMLDPDGHPFCLF